MKKLCVALIFHVFSFAVFSQNTALNKIFSRESASGIEDPAMIVPEEQHPFDPSKIDIVRDRFGVPHIFAETDGEVAYGLAWAHAEDDFETIQKSFLASRSMLGQHSGREGAIIDH